MRVPLQPLPFAVLALVAFSGCGDDGASLHLQVEGVTGLESIADLDINWAGDVSYTREVRCGIERGDDAWDYTVTAFDASVDDELGLELRVQTYDGPDGYDRDENQPLSPFALRWALPEGGGEWRADVALGGACTFEIGGQSDRGIWSCSDVVVTFDAVEVEERATITGSWDCGRVDFDVERRGGRTEPLPDDEFVIGR